MYGPKLSVDAAGELSREGTVGGLIGEAHEVPNGLALAVAQAPVAGLLVDLKRERRGSVADLIGDPVRIAPRLGGEHRPGAPQGVRRDSGQGRNCLLYTSPSPRDGLLSRMP